MSAPPYTLHTPSPVNVLAPRPPASPPASPHLETSLHVWLRHGKREGPYSKEGLRRNAGGVEGRSGTGRYIRTGFDRGGLRHAKELGRREGGAGRQASG